MAIGGALLITMVIFGIWISILFPGTISSQATIAENNEVKDRVEVSSLDRARANLGQSFEAVKVQWAKVVESFKETKYQATNQLEIVAPKGTENTDYPATNNDGSVIH